MDTDHYLERIFEGAEIYRRHDNPFETKPEQEHSNSPSNRGTVNPHIIKKAAKTMEKNETRVPVFFLPYLKKTDEG